MSAGASPAAEARDVPREDLPPGFMVVHGNRLEDLRSLAVAWMRRYPLAPLENEVLLVQSNGIAQWLKLALAADPDEDGCGIAAALEMMLPARFLWRAYQAVLGPDAVPETASLDKAGMVWRLMRLLPTLLGQAVFAPLRRFLADDDGLRKRFQLAERLADLFDQYQFYRADWLHAWARGDDVRHLSRGGVQPLGEDDAWQPALWRALLDDAGGSGQADSRAALHGRFVEALGRQARAPAGLPRRVIVFGISSMPAQTLEALAALARHVQVLLCVHNPCQYYWADIVADQDLLRHLYRRHARRPDTPLPGADDLARHAHPLLAAWGKQGRDYIHLLDVHDDPGRYRGRFADLGEQRIDLFEGGPTDTVLGQLQDDILNLRTLPETRARWEPAGGDRSIRFHVAHSPQREVEILHDQLLARFEADPTLRPRDVIVMVPAIDAYAPHVRAVFGQHDRRDPRRIPYTLADQGRRGADPLLIALEHLLGLPESRFAVADVLDLLDVPALRRRFGLTEADLPLLRDWIDGAGVRWGLDAEQRAQLDLPDGLAQNTWTFGLQRMLLGYASGDGECFQGIVPYGDVGGLDAARLGPLALLLDALARHRAVLREDVPPARWGERLRALLADCFASGGEADDALLDLLHHTLDAWLAACEQAGLTEPMPLAVVREAWLAAIDQPRLNQRFLAGSVNVCTLMPMRAIPFRVVCLLGMNDGDYPRVQPPLDFDLMRDDYRPGDRSRREDDRYLLLEAVLSARDALHIGWVGRDIRDNAERPPSVLVGQLREHLAAGWRADEDDDGQRLLASMTTVHPLQPFSRRYFDGGDPALFSYASEWLAVHADGDNPARTGREPSGPVPGESAGSAGPVHADGDTVDDEVPDLLSLARFLRDPVAAYFNQRLGVYFDAPDEAAAEAEPFALDGLTRHAIADRLLRAALAGAGDDAAVEAALRGEAGRVRDAGLLPLGGFGARLLDELIEPAQAVAARWRHALQRWPEVDESALPLRIDAATGRLEGWLPPTRRAADGTRALLLAFPDALQANSGPRWRRLLPAWTAHVVAAASAVPLTTRIVASDGEMDWPPMDPGDARHVLAGWLDAWRAARAAPLPVALQTACVWLASRARGEDGARRAAWQAYEGGFDRAGERDRNSYLARQYPDAGLLFADGGFDTWSHALYGALVAAVMAAEGSGGNPA